MWLRPNQVTCFYSRCPVSLSKTGSRAGCCCCLPQTVTEGRSLPSRILRMSSRVLSVAAGAHTTGPAPLPASPPPQAFLTQDFRACCGLSYSGSCHVEGQGGNTSDGQSTFHVSQSTRATSFCPHSHLVKADGVGWCHPQFSSEKNHTAERPRDQGDRGAQGPGFAAGSFAPVT